MVFACRILVLSTAALMCHAAFAKQPPKAAATESAKSASTQPMKPMAGRAGAQSTKPKAATKSVTAATNQRQTPPSAAPTKAKATQPQKIKQSVASPVKAAQANQVHRNNNNNNKNSNKNSNTSPTNPKAAPKAVAPILPPSRVAPTAPLPITPAALAAPAPLPEVIEPIYTVNQYFSKVPLTHCPLVSKGYGLEITYPAANSQELPVIKKVYGNARLAGVLEGVTLRGINGHTVHTQADFNAIAFAGRSRQANHLIDEMTLDVVHNGVVNQVALKKGDYCLSNLTVESEYNILRMDFSSKGYGYAAKADARVFVNHDFFAQLTRNDQLTLAAVAAAEQYRNSLRVKRGKVGLFAGQVFGTVVTLFTGVPVTDLTASGASAMGQVERGDGATRPAVSYGYYLGLTPSDMRASLEKLARYRSSYQVQGKRYDWPIPDDLSDFDAAQAELNERLSSGKTDLMLKPIVPSESKASNKKVAPIEAELGAGVGTY
jgi:hypothetical protein